ncbi:uncharacterized protein LOC134844478 isoform X2 [Symsagittifera roscoffensis]|uniref:uncharacterized protein LOC134844478 isoform X2 n=1 Tax=Symsagittifera roscoffensis TaxID=84072 RepID=UPI00307BFBE1
MGKGLLKSETFCWILLLLAVPVYSLAIVVLIGVVYLANYAAQDGTTTTGMGIALCLLSFIVFAVYNVLAFYITFEDYSNQARYERIQRKKLRDIKYHNDDI